MKKIKEYGFSFVEILVVITIIGIIAAIGTVSYTQFLMQSRDAKRKGDLEQIRAALEMYKSKNNLYPLSNEIIFGGDLCDPVGGCATGTYLKKIPNDPKTNSNTYYYQSTTGADYIIGSYLEQGSTSTCGDCDLVGTQTCNYCLGPYGQL
ncbi:MAG: type II secretion system protein GspG [Patescibacteria group bacterium]